MLTLKIARAALREVGVVISFDWEDDEYRVNFAKGKEATAYYTNDLVDALGTGIAMASWRDERANAQFLKSPLAKL